MEFSPSMKGMKASRLSLSKKRKIFDSPKTPKQSAKIGHADVDKSDNSVSPNFNTPESYKHIKNLLNDDSPTSSYENISHSQKLLLDGDRDVVWNWGEKSNQESYINDKKDFPHNLNISKSLLHLINNQAQERKKPKLNKYHEGLKKLQALQKKKCSNNLIDESTSALKNDLHRNHLVDKNKNQEMQVPNLESPKQLLTLKENMKSININNKMENNTNITFGESLEKHSLDEDDTLLIQVSQKVERLNNENLPSFDDFKDDFEIFNYNEQSSKATSMKSSSSSNFYAVSEHKNFAQNKLDPKKDKLLSIMQHEDSFDDIFLSIDLSSLNSDVKKEQFKRHSSMPNSENKKTESKGFVRCGSANDFFNKDQKSLFSTTKNISEVSGFSSTSTKNIGMGEKNALSNPLRRCTKEEVEAKRIEAKQRRLLRMNKVSTK